MFFFILLLPLLSFATEDLCVDPPLLKEANIFELLNNLSSADCGQLKQIKNNSDLEAAVETILLNEMKRIKDIPNERHQIAQTLNDCTPQKNSSGLVISFAGTGAFSPLSYNTMGRFLNCFGDRSLPPELAAKLFYAVEKMGSKHSPNQYRWSGIENGPLSQFLIDPTIMRKAKNLDFAVFASEESEIIADPKNLSWEKFKKIPKELELSKLGQPPGVRLALECTKKYLTEAKTLKITPKIIVISHSSGGRSAVKFAEGLKHDQNGAGIDLVFSIDPVKEAHEAMKEVMGQYAGQLADYLPFIDREKHPVNVWTREQPKVLYKPSSVSNWVNVYQNVDTEGLKGKVKFGIHGSPVVNANKNMYVSKGLGSDAHGSICYSPETNLLFVSEMKKILK